MYSRNGSQHVTRLLIAMITALLMSACMGNRALEEGRKLSASGQHEAAVEKLAQAMRDDPEDQAARMAWLRARDALIMQTLSNAERLRQAGRNDEYAKLLKKVQALDPENPKAQALLDDFETAGKRAKRLDDAEKKLTTNNLAEAEQIVRSVLTDAPGDARARNLMRRIDSVREEQSIAEPQVLQSPFTKPITLEFREASLRNVFEVISRTAGINFVFDKDVRPDTKVTVFVRNTSIDDVLKLVLTTNQLERKFLNANSVLIYPATPAKQKDYQELVTRTFFLGNIEAKQAQALIKQVVKTRDVFIDEKINVMVIKDTPDAVRLAEQLVRSIDVAEPEVMLEVEVLEVSRSKLDELGLRFPDSIGYGALRSQQTTVQTQTASGITSQVVTVPGSEIAPGVIPSRQWDNLTIFSSNPLITLNLKNQDSDSNLLANPRIRVRNREKAKIHIGDKLPVFTTTSTANVGVAASVSYLDVGLKLDVEPIVRLSDDVEMKVTLEVSSIVKEITGPQNSLAYQIGTRNTATALRLKDGETQVLAGLISDEERSSANRLPGVGKLPVLGRLFSSERDANNKTEIVLLITPHVLRNVLPPAQGRLSIPSGTESAVGAPPLVLAPTAARSLEVRASGGAVNPSGLPNPTTSFLPPTGMAQPPAPPSAVDPSPSGAVIIVGPNQALPGQELTLTFNLRNATPMQGGQLTVQYDNAVFETLDGKGNGSTDVVLAATGNTASTMLRLRVRADAKGAGSVNVVGGTVQTETGSMPVNGGSALNVRIGAPLGN